MPKVDIVCKRVGCDNTFTAYPSSNKKYCNPKCRYSDPAKAETMFDNIKGRHKLSNIDPENSRATCSVCGPVNIRKRIDKNINRKYSDLDRWRCKGAEKARDWAYKYGMSVSDVTRLLESQENKCKICSKIFDQNFYVDHCHKSGLVRGLLCNQCNTGIGLLQDDVDILRSAVKYLEDHLEATKPV